MKPRFKIETQFHSWTCGDGCCSESGYSLSIFDNHENKIIHEDRNWEYHWNEERIIKDSLEFLEDLLGREPILNEDYILDSDGFQ